MGDTKGIMEEDKETDIRERERWRDPEQRGGGMMEAGDGGSFIPLSFNCVFSLCLL